MALAQNAFTTYAAIGNREDLADIIYRIDPTDTPYYTGIERARATAVNHEWQTQALAAPDSGNAQLEGDDNVVATVTTPTVRLGNIAQISTKIPRVTGTQRVVEHAGRDDEMAYQEMLKGLELKRDMETILCGTNQAKNTGAETTPRRLASLLSWIITNTNATGTNPAVADGTGTRTDGTQRAYAETQLKDVLQKVWISGGKPELVMCGAYNKQAMSLFTGRGTPVQDQAERRITAAVDTYESDFGKLRVTPNRFQRPRDVFVLQMDMWAYAPLPGRNMVSFPLAKTGDTDRKQILCEYTLESRNEKASGAVYDLTTA